MTLAVALRHAQGDFRLEAAFEVAGGVTALFGPSGAGKSSIVAAVAGLLRPQQGRIVLNGRVLTDTASGLFLPPHRRRAGLVFQEARLFPHLTVRGNLLYGWRRAPERAATRQIDRIIALLGLEALLARWPQTLSGGEKARVALGRALLSSPEILLLDEPLAALDAGRREEILPYLERLRDAAGVPMLYVSHAIDEVARLADQVVLLEQGRVAGTGPAAQCLPGRAGLGAVLDARVTGRRADGLALLATDAGEIALAIGAQAGARLRLRIAAADILIARVLPEAISANNILPATVREVAVQEDQAEIGLAAGTARLVARITAASARRLELAPGLPVFAIIKSMTVAF